MLRGKKWNHICVFRKPTSILASKLAMVNISRPQV